jgi:Adenylate and Guanylate cyclase catalytic domain
MYTALLILTISKVFDKLGEHEENKVVVGAVSAGIYWRTYLTGMFPREAIDVIVVLKNACGQTFTYRLDGEDSKFVGEGDLHDSRYDDLASPVAMFRGYGNETSQESESCTYSAQAFPSRALEDAYMTRAPMVYAISMAAVFVFTSTVFLLYDFSVEKRQKVILKSALQSGAIVTSLFPEQVHDQLYREQERHNDSKKQTESKGPVRAPATANALSYPNCSVCFMDLAGFTSWSSSRSPAHVFDLLESVYGAFDAIARRRKVFKVETIGDCCKFIEQIGIVLTCKSSRCCSDRSPRSTIRSCRYYGEFHERVPSYV